MLKLIEYARLASHVYSPKKDGIDGVNIGIIKKIKQDTEWYCMTDVDTHMQPTNPFYAQLYIKFEGNRATEAVMAIRGTDINEGAFIVLNNLGEDTRSWWSDVLLDGKNEVVPFCKHQARQFYQRCQDYVQRYFPTISQITLTGHSLGGAIAQLLVLTPCTAVPVVAFNAPGCGQMPGIVPSQAHWITNVNAKYGFINKIGSTLGRVYYIEGLPKDAEAKRLFDTFDKAAYDVSNKIDQWADKEVGISKLYGREAAIGVRLLAYLESLNKLNATPELQQQYANCNSQLQGPAVTSRAAVRAPHILPDPALGCELQALLKEYKEVIKAEHDIDNLIAALHHAENKQLADSPIASLRI